MGLAIACFGVEEMESLPELPHILDILLSNYLITNFVLIYDLV